jgi:hypothetical protein
LTGVPLLIGALLGTPWRGAWLLDWCCWGRCWFWLPNCCGCWGRCWFRFLWGIGLYSIGWMALGSSAENLAVGKLAGECCYPTPVPRASSSWGPFPCACYLSQWHNPPILGNWHTCWTSATVGVHHTTPSESGAACKNPWPPQLGHIVTVGQTCRGTPPQTWTLVWEPGTFLASVQ